MYPIPAFTPSRHHIRSKECIHPSTARTLLGRYSATLYVEGIPVSYKSADISTLVSNRQTFHVEVNAKGVELHSNADDAFMIHLQIPVIFHEMEWYAGGVRVEAYEMDNGSLYLATVEAEQLTHLLSKFERLPDNAPSMRRTIEAAATVISIWKERVEQAEAIYKVLRHPFEAKLIAKWEDGEYEEYPERMGVSAKRWAKIKDQQEDACRKRA